MSDNSLTLFCWVLGDRVESVFPVEIAPGKTVGSLRDAIKEKRELGCRADQLDLWKATIPRSQRQALLGSNEYLKEITESVPLDPISSLSEEFKDPLPEDNVYIVIVRQPLTPSTFTKKRKREVAEDIIIQLRSKWNLPVHNDILRTNLHSYLEGPLDMEEKVPISNYDWELLLKTDGRFPHELCLPEDLENLFRKSEDEIADTMQTVLKTAITSITPNTVSTEDAFHSFWDDNILKILLACLGTKEWIRNSNRTTCIGSFKPDFGLFLDNTCVFRGEEKHPAYGGVHPRVELVEKTRWVYDPAPYVLGYHAVGAKVTIVSIHPNPVSSPNAQVTVRDIIDADLSNRQERIRHATRMIKLVKVLRALQQIMKKGVDLDMFNNTREGGKSIQFMKCGIRKTYRFEGQDRVSSLQKIYGYLEAKKVPNVDRLVKAKIDRHDVCFVELEPLGIDSGPKSPEDVKNAVMCVLQALKVLHTTEPKIIHRDIRWPNIMRSNADPMIWFLIDWEDAAYPPAQAARHMHHGTHAPQVFQDGHGTEVDLWAVGKLITSSSIRNLPENLISLGQRMVDGVIETAEQGLEELK